MDVDRLGVVVARISMNSTVDVRNRNRIKTRYAGRIFIAGERLT